MDRNTEKFTMNLFEKIKPNCAIFFISHRLNALQRITDVIYVLDNKTITHYGSHNELMQNEKLEKFLDATTLL